MRRAMTTTVPLSEQCTYRICFTQESQLRTRKKISSASHTILLFEAQADTISFCTSNADFAGKVFAWICYPNSVCSVSYRVQNGDNLNVKLSNFDSYFDLPLTLHVLEGIPKTQNKCRNANVCRKSCVLERTNIPDRRSENKTWWKLFLFLLNPPPHTWNIWSCKRMLENALTLAFKKSASVCVRLHLCTCACMCEQTWEDREKERERDRERDRAKCSPKQGLLVCFGTPGPLASVNPPLQTSVASIKVLLQDKQVVLRPYEGVFQRDGFLSITSDWSVVQLSIQGLLIPTFVQMNQTIETVRIDDLLT